MLLDQKKREFSQEVHKQLKDEDVLDAITSNDKEGCTIELAIKVYEIIRKYHVFHMEEFGELLLFTVSCDQEDRNKLENILQ